MRSTQVDRQWKQKEKFTINIQVAKEVDDIPIHSYSTELA